jgi:hypothetical protein
VHRKKFRKPFRHVVLLDVHGIAHDVEGGHVHREEGSVPIVNLTPDRRKADQPEAVVRREPDVRISMDHLEK